MRIERANGFSLYGTPVVPRSDRAFCSNDLSSSLQTAGIIAGIFLLLVGIPDLLKPELRTAISRHVFRARAIAGASLLTIDLVWSFWLLATMEMGEFSTFRRPLLIALPIGYFLALRFVDEFLAVRALGILCLLAAEPLLDAAFFRYETAGFS